MSRSILKPGVLAGGAIAVTVLVAATVALWPSAAPTQAVASRPEILTTKNLRQLQPLKETDEIKPTGKVREFALTLKPGTQEIVKGTVVETFAFNGQVPGPTIRVTEGDTIRVTVRNELPETTSVHWHGLHVPYQMDGVPPFSQAPIQPGKSFVYEFTANHAGTYMYHSHENSIKQIDRGAYGALIIDPQNPAEQPKFDRDYTMMLSGWIVDESKQMQPAAGGSMPGMAGGQSQGGMQMGYNYWTINGKAFPDVPPLQVKTGERVRIRLINISNLAHPMHLHGQDFRVIAEDGHPIKEPRVMNTIDVGPGKTYDIEFVADNPGVWVFHCHELHHTANGEVEPGGLIQVIHYEGVPLTPPAAGSAEGRPANQPAPMPSNMPGMRH